MKYSSISGYLSDTHRQDLLREAQQAALAAGAPAATETIRDRVLSMTANLLLVTGRRLNAYLCQKHHAQSAIASMTVCDTRYTDRHTGMALGLAYHDTHTNACKSTR